MNSSHPDASPSLTEHVVGAAMQRLRRGSLELVTHDGSQHVFAADADGPAARVVISDPRAARRLVAGTSVGMAEGYMEQEWDSPDLDAVLDLGLANLVDRPGALNSPLNPVRRLWHALRDNTPAGSKRNIAHHYDLGNDFYRLWLDETMAYSSAIFEHAAETLAGAQRRKWDQLLDLLQPSRSDRLLEIGCGWGGFAIHAAQEAGCRVTGVTLSEEQHAWATKAVQEAGLEDRVDIRLQDYRDVPDSFTAVASIEMFEAVGERWWPVFFERLRDLLGPHGVAALQTITIDESRFESYRRQPDFIQRYIFPGGMLPSLERFRDSAEQIGLAVGTPSFFGDSYARTLVEWRQRFESVLPQVRELGFDERFIRMWRYYLAYCRAGFDAGTVNVMQVRVEP